MPEATVSAEGKPQLSAVSRNGCCRSVTASSRLDEGKQCLRRADAGVAAVIGNKCMADDFRLLFKAIPVERAARHKLIGIAAERVGHQRERETAAGLGL